MLKSFVFCYGQNKSAKVNFAMRNNVSRHIFAIQKKTIDKLYKYE